MHSNDEFCTSSYLHKLPLCNITYGCGLPYMDKACTIHTLIYTIKPHVYYEDVHTYDMHDTHAVVKLWVTCNTNTSTKISHDYNIKCY